MNSEHTATQSHRCTMSRGSFQPPPAGSRERDQPLAHLPGISGGLQRHHWTAACEALVVLCGRYCGPLRPPMRDTVRVREDSR